MGARSVLANHPWFELVAVAASPASAGKPHSAVAGRSPVELRVVAKLTYTWRP